MLWMMFPLNADVETPVLDVPQRDGMSSFSPGSPLGTSLTRNLSFFRQPSDSLGSSWYLRGTRIDLQLYQPIMFCIFSGYGKTRVADASTPDANLAAWLYVAADLHPPTGCIEALPFDPRNRDGSTHLHFTHGIYSIMTWNGASDSTFNIVLHGLDCIEQPVQLDDALR